MFITPESYPDIDAQQTQGAERVLGQTVVGKSLNNNYVNQMPASTIVKPFGPFINVESAEYRFSASVVFNPEKTLLKMEGIFAGDVFRSFYRAGGDVETRYHIFNEGLDGFTRADIYREILKRDEASADKRYVSFLLSLEPTKIPIENTRALRIALRDGLSDGQGIVDDFGRIIVISGEEMMGWKSQESLGVARKLMRLGSELAEEKQIH